MSHSIVVECGVTLSMSNKQSQNCTRKTKQYRPRENSEIVEELSSRVEPTEVITWSMHEKRSLEKGKPCLPTLYGHE